ncbi:hypothetical protein [Streptomyces antarcticus]|uniref:hypothetical protein n=1 Tax=Streptomyces antarcticus TaxID=2996458 RepID=UPI0022704DA0|nr:MULTISPECIES: hypothetical protein [unclassified Streptomyces]MCY0941356.1 hypothetical protein [Streptomyces sp. H34-AA3]MCZ4084782.1 hypothetical protein [Streptomyces sp. H34-S5]
MSYHGWQEVIGAAGVFGLAVVVITIVIWHLAATWRARAILARDYQYRTLTEKSLQVQQSTEQQLAGIKSSLTDLQDRMRSVERILKEIE